MRQAERVDRVWYAAYGSNLSAERFTTYLTGGRPAGAGRDYPGARDRSAPLADRPLTLDGEVYFAWESPTWGGGIAFYDPSAAGGCPSRAWLVTGQQFSDIASQEMHRPTGRDLPLADLFRQSRTAVLGPGRYETLQVVGELDAIPVVTFTASWIHRDAPLNAPTRPYLRTMVTGLRQSQGWDATVISGYLQQRPGAAASWSMRTMRLLVDEVLAELP